MDTSEQGTVRRAAGGSLPVYEQEQRTILGSRSWGADELDATDDPLYPDCFADLVRRQSHVVTADGGAAQ